MGQQVEGVGQGTLHLLCPVVPLLVQEQVRGRRPGDGAGGARSPRGEPGSLAQQEAEEQAAHQPGSDADDLQGEAPGRPSSRAGCPRPVRWLNGGNAAWRAAGYALYAGGRGAWPTKQFDGGSSPTSGRTIPPRPWTNISPGKFDLLQRVERDGTANFKLL